MDNKNNNNWPSHSPIIGTTYTFNDVLMMPQFSECTSRKDLNTTTMLTKSIRLRTPIISANMDTVTEEKMAIAMALQGGLGIIHRFNDPEGQANMVRNVKKHMSYRITNPYTISAKGTIKDFHDLVKRTGVHTFPVLDEKSNFIGMVSMKNTLFSQPSDLIQEIVDTSFLKSGAYCNPDVTPELAYQLMKKHQITKLPILHPDDTSKIEGLITLRDINHYQNRDKIESVDSQGRLLVGAAVGVNERDKERVKKLVQAEVDVIVVDIAHGHSKLCGEMTKWIKEQFPKVQVIAGNVATAEGVRYLANCGADSVKVGIGPASVCTTRDVTGCGVPQLSALLECSAAARLCNITVISDGGHGKKVGNMAKALAAGAACVMLGNSLAGTDETPGQVLVKEGKRVKIYRGMSGFGANINRKSAMEATEDVTDVVPEGVEGIVPYKGPVRDILYQIVGGIRSSMSYNGVNSLAEWPSKVKFVIITQAGLLNSGVHDILKV